MNFNFNIKIFERTNKSSVINIKMVEYNKVNIKLPDTQLKTLKNAVKKKTGTTLTKCLTEIIYHMNYY